MTRDTTRPADLGTGHHAAFGSSETDLLSGLWEEAPFARLPWDAPSELKEFVEDIDNPKRVYAVHKASRRHNFQLLVQKYVVQLRDGCGADFCSTPTCFTCRKRIVGRAPIRRYNPTSARTLAVYLASQDNAENGLCPGLKTPKTASVALNSLIFTPNKKNAFHHEQLLASRKGPESLLPGYKPSSSRGSHVPHRPGSPRTSRPDPTDRETSRGAQEDALPKAEVPKAKFTVREEHSSNDYRSFTANLFGTVAFKMLEWLTPSGIEEMSRRAYGFQDEDRDNKRPIQAKKAKEPTEPRARSPRRHSVPPTSNIPNGNARGGLDGSAEHTESSKGTRENGIKEDQSWAQPRPTAARPGNSRRNSNAQVRRPSGPNPKRQLSIDPIPHDFLNEESYKESYTNGHVRSPRLGGPQSEKSSKGIKTGNSALTRPISQLSSAGYFDAVKLETMPPLPPKSVDIKSKSDRGQASDSSRSSGPSSPKTPASSLSRASSDKCDGDHTPDSDEDGGNLLPQTLSRLNADVVNFICDVLQEDGTSEAHMLEPAVIPKFHNKHSSHSKALRRRTHSQPSGSVNMKLEWKLFVEQTIFYVLSDAQLAVRSFSKKGQLYDSHTLWYCMLRLTRVAPSVVLHSLWLAAAGLFAPPKSLQSLRSPTARLFPPHEKSLSNAEAGFLMSICLHALVAAAPLVNNAQDLSAMSRIRSQGLSLAGSGAVPRQSAELCLQYDDAFTNDLAVRLARRLFAAITTRRYFDEMKDIRFERHGIDEPDVLAPMFSQLNINGEAAYILDFPFAERTLHEVRVPTLLIDWAKTIMLGSWDGSPEVPGDGPFGGALSLVEALYQRRKDLLLGDPSFKCEYFADRLDGVEMPVAWLSHTSSKQKLHLLDFPYLFNPSTLVSYFRSINFSRMSRSFEESSSLQSRTDAIMLPGSLIINPHHKDVLQDLLKVASSKYLILDISRDNVVRDAFDQLWRRQERELLRPLKVHLGENDGEEGFDSGGVQQEFFRMAIAEVLNPDYGAFTVDERTRMTWFQPGSIEADWKFEMVGLLVSLAVYNGLTLPVTFPKALYRKLLGEPVTELRHIEDGWPDLASGLTTLSDWDEKDGSVEDVFARTYEFSVSMFGKPITRQMKPPASPTGPKSILGLSSGLSSPTEEWPQLSRRHWHLSDDVFDQTGHASADEAPLVTNANRHAYVSDYIRYLTDVSVRPQYEAFARGFRTCLHPKSLTLLTSNLLQSVVEGIQEIDIAELRRYARYVGWDASHRTVRDFWSIVKRYDDAMKRRLLEFVTASDRVPVGGIKNLQFVIQKNGTVDGPGGHLPTAYTCYGTLLLPEYKDKEILRERMAMALQNAQGFGFA